VFRGSGFQRFFENAKSLESLRIPEESLEESLARVAGIFGLCGPLAEPESCDKKGITDPAWAPAKMRNHEKHERTFSIPAICRSSLFVCFVVQDFSRVLQMRNLWNL
jgi:hypothetical protein